MKAMSVLAILAVAGAAGMTGVASAQECPLSKGSCSDQRPTLTAASHEMADDIVDTAVKAGKFNTLAAALKAAGLVETLKGAGPFTVFAPTDEAFAKLPKGALDDLLKAENKEKLVSILKYHVVSGRVFSGDAIAAKHAKTLQGGEVKISSEGGVKIDNATVTSADLDASNGVIHVIDTVIMPKSK